MLLATAALAAAGCTPTVTRETKVEDVRRYSGGAYREVYSIRTAPAGARVYVDGAYVGTAPVTGKTDVFALAAVQAGRFPVTFRRYRNQDIFTINARLRDRTLERTGPTAWPDTLTPDEVTGRYVVRATKPGYRPVEVLVAPTPDDAVVQAALTDLELDEEGRPADPRFTGRRTLRLTLEPAGP